MYWLLNGIQFAVVIDDLQRAMSKNFYSVGRLLSLNIIARLKRAKTRQFLVLGSLLVRLSTYCSKFAKLLNYRRLRIILARPHGLNFLVRLCSSHDPCAHVAVYKFLTLTAQWRPVARHLAYWGVQLLIPGCWSEYLCRGALTDLDINYLISVRL